MASETPGIAMVADHTPPEKRPSAAQRKIDVTDVRLRRVVDLATDVPDEFAEVFIERKGSASFLVGRS